MPAQNGVGDGSSWPGWAGFPRPSVLISVPTRPVVLSDKLQDVFDIAFNTFVLAHPLMKTNADLGVLGYFVNLPCSFARVAKID